MNAARGEVQHAGAVRARARVATRALFLARVGESVHIGGCAALLALACILLEGGRTDRLDSALVAVLCGLLAAATWALGHRRTQREVAQRLDDRLGHDGAFLTAWEQDGETRGGVLAELLVLRTARAVPGRVAARAALPHSWPILATPFLAGALVAALSSGSDPALELREQQRLRLAADLGSLAGEPVAGELSFEEERALRELARSAAALAEGSGGAAADLEREALLRDLRELGDRLPGRSGVGQRLDELAGRLEAAAGAAEGGADGGSDSGTDGPALARAETDGTMVPRESRPGPMTGAAGMPEAAWIDSGDLPPDLRRILDDWAAAPPGGTRR